MTQCYYSHRLYDYSYSSSKVSLLHYWERIREGGIGSNLVDVVDWPMDICMWLRSSLMALVMGEVPYNPFSSPGRIEKAKYVVKERWLKYVVLCHLEGGLSLVAFPTSSTNKSINQPLDGHEDSQGSYTSNLCVWLQAAWAWRAASRPGTGTCRLRSWLT